MTRPYVRPTIRQRELLAAFIEAPSAAMAATAVGLTAAGYRAALAKMRARTGLSTERAIYFGLRDGWLVVREERMVGT